MLSDTNSSTIGAGEMTLVETAPPLAPPKRVASAEAAPEAAPAIAAMAVPLDEGAAAAAICRAESTLSQSPFSPVASTVMLTDSFPILSMTNRLGVCALGRREIEIV